MIALSGVLAAATFACVALCSVAFYALGRDVQADADDVVDFRQLRASLKSKVYRPAGPLQATEGAVESGSEHRTERHHQVDRRLCGEGRVSASLPEDATLRKSLRAICAEFPSLLAAELAPGFEANYARWFDQGGWVDEAYVNYFARESWHNLSKGFPKKHFYEPTELLITSVHQYSTRPIVAFNFGPEAAPEEWTAERFPQLVLFRAPQPLPPSIATWAPAPNVFNFNKFRAMLLAQVRVGIELDSDQFVFGHIDRMFQRTRDEVTADYPYPVLPTHWMTRDDDPEYVQRMPFKEWAFACPGCPRRTMRWGHAHPTWTYHALPFLGELFAGALQLPHRVIGLSANVSSAAETDEGFFNLGLWSVGASKQWCKFDVPTPPFDFVRMINGKQKVGRDTLADPKWFPWGVPLVFYSAHGVKANQTRESLKHLAGSSLAALPEVYFNRTFYSSGEELLRVHKPGCLL